MKFIVDNALSPLIADQLTEFGFDAIHVRNIDLQHATDQAIFDFAEKYERIIISADTNFGLLLSQRNKQYPSVIIFRKGAEKDPIQQSELLKSNLTKKVVEALHSGSIIIIERNKIRVKFLPIYRF